jgi:hypothetical protein
MTWLEDYKYRFMANRMPKEPDEFLPLVWHRLWAGFGERVGSKFAAIFLIIIEIGLYDWIGDYIERRRIKRELSKRP